MTGSSLVDMHIHTTASDGTWNVDEVLKNIYEKNIKLFSITDHDTIENSIEVLKRVKKDLICLLGVEATCNYKGKEYHLTTYQFDRENNDLKELFAYNKTQRIGFNRRVVDYAKNMGVISNSNDYEEYDYQPNRGGWNSLNYLIDKGVIKDLRGYFELVNSSGEYLEFKSPVEVIDVLKRAGGKVFLAHPSSYSKDGILGKEELDYWNNLGIDGIECYTPYNKSKDVSKYYIDYCENNNLMISSGSDCHGDFNDRVLGQPKVTLDMVKLDFI